MTSLAAWLASLDAAELTEVLRRRPDAAGPYPPESLSDLAERLARRDSVHAALLALPRPAVQAAEAVAALGGACSRGELAALLGPTDGTGPGSGLDTALSELRAAALVWPDGDRLRAGPLRQFWPRPLGLGRPLSALLGELTVEGLRSIAAHLPMTARRVKKELVADLERWLSDPTNVRRLVSSAPPEARELLAEAADGAEIGRDMSFGFQLSPTERWALERGLLFGGQWGLAWEISREVALALRGPDYRAPFDPDPPGLVTSSVAPEAVERESAAAASAAVTLAAALLEECSRQPVRILKNDGRIGVREQRRLAKLMDSDAETIGFWLGVVNAAGMVRATDTGVAPTEQYDRWRDQEPAGRLVVLLTGWLALRWCPPHEDTVGDGHIRSIRLELLRIATEVPGSEAVRDGAALADVLAYRRPLLAGRRNLDQLCGALWREAEMVGAAALGTLTELGRAVTAGAHPAVAEVAGRLLPAAETTVRFQADLTAVVGGTPAATVSALLDLAADLESRGSASTWRFSPASVRRALDAGTTADELLTALGEVASAELPQPLRYLVTDVARRHGAVRVRAVGCCLRCDDPALAAEIRRHRKLADLELTELAPTVLASTKPPAETLAALRAAGYAPVEEDADGTPRLERVQRHRAEPPYGWMATARRPSAVPNGHDALAPAELAARLLSATEPVPLSETARQLRLTARQLSRGEVRLLADAIDHGGAVRITYVNAQGNTSDRVIEELLPDGPMLHAWCRLREDDRAFALSRIQSVAPAPT